MASYGVFAKFYDQLTQNINYNNRAIYFDKLIQKFSPNVELVLDLACGTGSLSIALKKLGYDIIGIDNSADMLSVATEKKHEQDLDILFLKQDMTKLDLYGTVDVTICALDSMNHITEYDKLNTVFSKVSLFSNPKALFIFDLNTVYKHREILANHTYVYDLDEVYLTWQNTFEESKLMVELTLDFFEKVGKHYERTTEVFSEKAYECKEIEQLCKDNGFTILAVFEGDTFEPLKEDSHRAVYVVQKSNQNNN